MSPITIPATRFQQHTGEFMELSAKQPIIITKNNRPCRVLMDIAVYQDYVALSAHSQAHNQREAFNTANMTADEYAQISDSLEHLDTQLADSTRALNAHLKA